MPAKPNIEEMKKKRKASQEGLLKIINRLLDLELGRVSIEFNQVSDHYYHTIVMADREIDSTRFSKLLSYCQKHEIKISFSHRGTEQESRICLWAPND